jgi:hypothetical protein
MNIFKFSSIAGLGLSFLFYFTNSNFLMLSYVQENKYTTLYEVCFITSLYGSADEIMDRPVEVTDQFPVAQSQEDRFGFYLFTNLDDLSTLGWQKRVIKFSSPASFIRQSRWAKFMSWKDGVIRRDCKTVFYLDAIYGPHAIPEVYLEKAAEVLNSAVGLAQRRHPHRSGKLSDEILIITQKRKDTVEHAEALVAWFKQQDDFLWNCTVYHNAFLGKLVIYCKQQQLFTNGFLPSTISKRMTPIIQRISNCRSFSGITIH